MIRTPRCAPSLITFNHAHCARELKWFGQEVFELAEATSGSLRDPEYLAAKAANQGFGRGVINGLCGEGSMRSSRPRGALEPPRLRSPVSRACRFPSVTPGGTAGWALVRLGLHARAGVHPHGYALEQLLKVRIAPKLLGSVPPNPKPRSTDRRRLSGPGCGVPGFLM